ncbi:thiol-disulfide oxidoreductase DCC family protein [Phaeovulum sp. W22_SRMD_FR3]|uniref:thiol-disulfide oxidoreductase DCC family protein n=1 Tax=Phaeovulum sp. W22_SRMD_FR3 TaxID=3240274 RepID=UPI003F960D50
MSLRHPAGDETAGATVFYDGACPLCRAEIGIYRKAAGADALRFVDLSDPAAAPPEGVSRAEALARFHVRASDGRLVSGAAAFAELWAQLPRWRGLAWVARRPGLRRLLEWTYRGFLHLRPCIVWLCVRTFGARI